ncbi:MAG: DUF4388 domain-containing protein [Polyangiaceae bacterium]
MNGFELLAWLLEHRPSVSVFTMTAYGNEQTEQQLSNYGPVACFTKPIDVETVVARMTDSLSHDVRGHVRNMSLAPFLQLLEIERMSCTLNVERAGQRCTLFIQRGELVDVRLGQLSGEPAAAEVLAWNNATITISGSCPAVARTIDKPMSFVIMDALRLQDESARAKYVTRTSRPPRPSDGSGSLTVPPSALAVAIVDLRSGLVLAHGQRASVPLSELSEMALTILRHEDHAISCCDETEEVEELVLTSTSSCELIRRIPGRSAFMLMVFKPDETNLVIARLELERLLHDNVWLHSVSPVAS